jgi:hypothetical protein
VASDILRALTPVVRFANGGDGPHGPFIAGYFGTTIAVALATRGRAPFWAVWILSVLGGHAVKKAWQAAGDLNSIASAAELSLPDPVLMFHATVECQGHVADELPEACGGN